MNIQKSAKKALQAFFTIGASTTLGFLSFSGMYAIAPILALGIAAFGLSILYEGEIYHANIKKALKKLWQPSYFKQQTANEILNQIVAEPLSCDAPQFLKDYQTLYQYCQKNPHHQSALKQLKAMRRYFMLRLFNKQAGQSDYSESLQRFIKSQLNLSKIKISQQKKQTQRRLGLIFSILSGSLFGFGTLYLLADGIAALSFLSISATLLPYIIVSLSTLSAFAYCFLIYNTLSDIIQNDSLRLWFKEIKHDLTSKAGIGAKIRATTAIILIMLGVALTIFTAGTWWTVANKVPNTLPFLKRLPTVIAGVLVPVFTGLASLFFNLENTKDSMEMINHLMEADKPSSQQISANFAQKLRNFCYYSSKFLFITPIQILATKIQKAWQKESLLEFINPFRLLINIIQAPLKVFAFLGHIISIGVTTDQIPGVPTLISAGLSAVSEGFEDMHYFVEHDNHELDHDHSHNFPSLVIKTLLSPLHFLNTLWQYPLSDKPFKDIWHNTWHGHHHKHDEPKDLPKLTTSSLQQLALMRLQQLKSHYQYGTSGSLKERKYKAIQSMIDSIRTNDGTELNERLLSALECRNGSETIKETIAHHRFFSFGKTNGLKSIEKMQTEILNQNPSANI